MRESIRRRRWLLAATLVIGAIQLGFTTWVDPHVRCSVDPGVEAALAAAGLDPQERCLSDATAYHLLGRELAASNRYERPFDRVIFGEHRPTAEYPPLFSFALSMLDRVGVDTIERQQAMLGTLTAMLTALGAGLIAGALGARDRLAAAAALAVGLQPQLLQAHSLLMTEGMFVALVGGVTLAALAFVRSPTAVRAVGLGALLGTAALVRGEGLLWTPIVIGGCFLATRPRQPKLAIVALVCAAAVVLPWTARNAARFDELVPVSNNLGTVLDGANCELTYGGPTIGGWRSTFTAGSTDRDRPCFEGFAIETPDFSEVDAASKARRDGISHATDNVGRWPAVALARLGRTFGVFRPAQQVDLEVLEGRERTWQWAGTALWWITLPLAVAGLIVVARRDRAAGWIVAAPWAAVIVTTLVTYGNQRFRIGVDAIAIVLAVVALASVYDSVRRRPVASAPS